MRYAVFSGGKRIRPILCLEASRIFSEDDEFLLPAASALELIHAYSLIHDDLPALDDDDLRRGKPSCHVAFGEATAILAGNALLTLAFQILAESSDNLFKRCLRVNRELAQAVGTLGGMIGGQIADLEAEARPLDSRTLQYIHASKTGALIRASVRTGAILAGAEEGDLNKISTYGEKVGLVFQIVDDLLDVLGSFEELGKVSGKDAEHKKATYPGFYGVEESRAMAVKLAEEACHALGPFEEKARNLKEIARYLPKRAS